MTGLDDKPARFRQGPRSMNSLLSFCTTSAKPNQTVARRLRSSDSAAARLHTGKIAKALPPDVMLLALRRRLRLPLPVGPSERGQSGHGCGRRLDAWGDHALACTRTGLLARRAKLVERAWMAVRRSERKATWCHSSGWRTRRPRAGTPHAGLPALVHRQEGPRQQCVNSSPPPRRNNRMLTPSLLCGQGQDAGCIQQERHVDSRALQWQFFFLQTQAFLYVSSLRRSALPAPTPSPPPWPAALKPRARARQERLGVVAIRVHASAASGQAALASCDGQGHLHDGRGQRRGRLAWYGRPPRASVRA